MLHRRCFGERMKVMEFVVLQVLQSTAIPKHKGLSHLGTCTVHVLECTRYHILEYTSCTTRSRKYYPSDSVLHILLRDP